MKLAKIKYKHTEKSNGYWNLILESRLDVLDYIKITENQFSHDAIDFWFNYKNSDIEQINSHLVLGNPNKNLANLYIETSNKDEIKLADYCNHMDSIYDNKINNMFDMLPIRVNNLGGYSTFDSFYEIIDEFSCDIKQAKEYINNGLIDESDKTLSIDNKNLVIENDRFISADLVSILKANNCNTDYQLLNDFKYNLSFYSNNEIYHIFNKGIQNGLLNIFLETSLYDLDQFNKFKNMFELLMIENKNFTLNVHILKSNKFADIKTKVKNINIYNY